MSHVTSMFFLFKCNLSLCFLFCLKQEKRKKTVLCCFRLLEGLTQTRAPNTWFLFLVLFMFLSQAPPKKPW